MAYCVGATYGKPIAMIPDSGWRGRQAKTKSSITDWLLAVLSQVTTHNTEESKKK